MPKFCTDTLLKSYYCLISGRRVGGCTEAVTFLNTAVVCHQRGNNFVEINEMPSKAVEYEPNLTLDQS